MHSLLTKQFLTLEGIEGVGKTTAVKFIEKYFQEKNIPLLLTREPGGTPIAEKIRHILLTPNVEEKFSNDTELLLMFACRAQHIQQVIIPALKKGDWVLSDRYVDASFAYQGGGRQLDLDKIAMLDQWVVGDVYPRVTFLLDAPAHVGLARAKNRGVHDRIEQEKVDFFERVREVYLQRAQQFPERFKVIDATEPLEVVQAQITSILDELLFCV